MGSEGLLAAQARLTYGMGVRMLEDLTKALGISVDPHCRVRLTAADLPALVEAAKAARLALTLGPDTGPELLRLVRRYDDHLVTLSAWLVIPLPSWITPAEPVQETETTAEPDDLDD